MDIRTLRRIIRDESPSHIMLGEVVSCDPRGTRTASVRVSGGRVHTRVFTCDENLEINDKVIVVRMMGLDRLAVLGRILPQHGSALSKRGALAPPTNFGAYSFAGVTYCQWDTYPGEDVSWEIERALQADKSDATSVLVSRGSYYFYETDPGTTVYFRARAIRWLGPNNLMYSGWSSWAGVTCDDYEVPNLIIELTNRSGVQVGEGWVVTLDTDNANSFLTTTDASDPNVIGVAVETIANGAAGLVCISGYCQVYTSNAVLIGDYLFTSSTEGRASGSVTLAAGTFGRALTDANIEIAWAIVAASSGSGGGTGWTLMANSIQLYASDGSELVLYPATSAGLDNASAGAVAGDTVWLPARAITGNHTLTADVHYVGISRYASRLTGQITAGGGSTIETLTIETTGTRGLIGPGGGGTAKARDCDIIVTGASGYAVYVNGDDVECWNCYLDGNSGGAGYGGYRALGNLYVYGGRVVGGTAPFNE